MAEAKPLIFNPSGGGAVLAAEDIIKLDLKNSQFNMSCTKSAMDVDFDSSDTNSMLRHHSTGVLSNINAPMDQMMIVEGPVGRSDEPELFGSSIIGCNLSSDNDSSKTIMSSIQYNTTHCNNSYLPMKNVRVTKS